MLKSSELFQGLFKKYIYVDIYVFTISRTALTIFTKFLNLVKNRVVCLSVILSLNTNPVYLENHSKDFHKIQYYAYFKHEQTIQIDLCKKSNCLSVCLSVNTTLVNIESRSKDFHKIWYYIYFRREKMSQMGVNLLKNRIACLPASPQTQLT